jgi:hypothetical protein
MRRTAGATPTQTDAQPISIISVDAKGCARTLKDVGAAGDALSIPSDKCWQGHQ